MSKIKFVNKVLRLKQDVLISKDMPLKKFQEIEIVMDVIYINGYMVPPNLQNIFYTFVLDNTNLFDDVTKKW
jgi:hypothetical protein